MNEEERNHLMQLEQLIRPWITMDGEGKSSLDEYRLGTLWNHAVTHGIMLGMMKHEVDRMLKS